MKRGGRIVQVFQDCDLRCSHMGLSEIAKKAKIDLGKLAPGEYVVFFNTSRTHVKIAAAFGTLAHRRSEHGRFFDASCIVSVVRAFHNTGRLDYDEAIKDRLLSLLGRRAKQAEGNA